MRKKNTETQPKAQETFKLPNELSEICNLINAGQLGYKSADSDERYKHLGINPFDILIYRITKENDENQITVWDYVDDNAYNYGFAYENFGDITIHNKAEYFTSQPSNKLKLLGVVVGIVKPYDAEKLGELKPQTGEEITAVCADCRKQLTGTPEFIKKSGWEIEPKQLCLTCDLYGGK
jgi:hypothetical protein